MHIPLTTRLFSSFALLLLVASPATFATDDYLKALENEAESSAQLGHQKKQVVIVKKAVAQQPDSTFTPQQQAFYEVLMSEKPATAKIYKKLAAANKQKVANFYHRNNQDMTEVTRFLLKTYMQQ